MNATQSNPQTTTAAYDLVRGEFSADEAFDILNKLFRSKINFHAVRNFRSEERCGEQDPYCNERLDQLRASRAEMARLLKEAKNNGSRVRIDTEVKITIE